MVLADTTVTTPEQSTQGGSWLRTGWLTGGRGRYRSLGWPAWHGAVAGSALVVVVLAVGCGSAAPAAGPSKPADRSAAAPGATSTPSPSPSPPSAAEQAAEAVQGPPAVPTSAQLSALRSLASVIASMSPAQLAGQRVIYSFSGTSAPASLLSAIQQGEVGGVILFTDNITSQAQLTGLIAQLTAANASPQNPARRYPLLVMTDQEGGEVKRLPWAGPNESEAQIGASADPAAAAAAAGAQAAAGLTGVGLNVDLAPVLDVYRQAGDFDDQYQRSYSMNPAVVAAAGAAFIRALEAGGVAATVKHFPGLGAAGAGQDTDNEPVEIDLSASTLRSVDEAPYRAAIQAGVQLAMVSWATYPALDSRLLPAGLSPTIIQGELQQRLGFSGVTITDALGAGALGAYGSLGNRTMLAARAGMDALLCTGTAALPGPECLAGLEDGYLDGALPGTAFKAQLAQLLALRSSLG
jgi:beta-N-acetylhexosaminidase